MGRVKGESNKLRQEAYIAAYIDCKGVKSQAAKKSGVPRDTAGYWFENEDFRRRIKEAEEVWYDELKASLLKRATDKSDTLGIFFLKAHDPETYDDNIRAKRFLEEIIGKIKESLPVIDLFPQEKLQKPIE